MISVWHENLQNWNVNSFILFTKYTKKKNWKYFVSNYDGLEFCFVSTSIAWGLKFKIILQNGVTISCVCLCQNCMNYFSFSALRKFSAFQVIQLDLYNRRTIAFLKTILVYSRNENTVCWERIKNTINLSMCCSFSFLICDDVQTCNDMMRSD